MYPKKMKTPNSKKFMYLDVHSSIFHNSQDMEAKCPLTDKWIKKMYTMEEYSDIIKKQILQFATSWIDLKEGGYDA